ncbi:MAG TPA: hypothetical protein VFH87_01700 [Candidatus Udaeobacter sp.]|nr:hypothetical protein [Candidatus Udaeobacter sp.]
MRRPLDAPGGGVPGLDLLDADARDHALEGRGTLMEHHLRNDLGLPFVLGLDPEEVADLDFDLVSVHCPRRIS